VQVAVSPMALVKVLDVALREKSREVAGFLVGRVEGERVLVYDGVWMGEVGRGVRVEVDFNAMAKLVDKLEREGGREVIVGWWHSHPGMGADFMSGVDIKTQQIYQAFLPQAVALVVDPVEYERTGRIYERSCSFYVVENEKYKKVPFEVEFNLDEMVRVGISALQRKHAGEAYKEVKVYHPVTVLKEREEEIPFWELVSVALLIWTLIMASLLWIFTG